MFEKLRVLIIGAILLVGLILWNDWRSETYTNSQVQKSEKIETSIFPKLSDNVSSDVKINNQTDNYANKSNANIIKNIDLNLNNTDRYVTLSNNLISITIDKIGGNIVKAKLLKYAISTTDKNPLSFLDDTAANFLVIESGLISDDGPDTLQKQGIYKIDNQNVQKNNNDSNLVDLVWENKNNLIAHKIFSIKNDEYNVEIKYTFQNNSDKNIDIKSYMQYQFKKSAFDSAKYLGINSYVGASLSTQDKPYKKFTFDDFAKENLDITQKSGWVAVQKHYFVSAIIPTQTDIYNYYTAFNKNDVTKSDDIYNIGVAGEKISIQPNSEYQKSFKVFIGPQITSLLEKTAPNLKLTTDFGIFWFLSYALIWILKRINDVTCNWGLSIIGVTLLIKIAFYHLSAKSYKSMSGMKNIQPKLQAIKQACGDDKQKMAKETMELYRKEKLNPFGGCLPTLIQIPVFLALYFALMESVELRQASFLWINDLSLKDPYYILPILMGATMYIQQSLNPNPITDKTQMNVLKMMPIFMVFLFSTFPAGLVLYWTFNNLFSIIQQWLIVKKYSKVK